MVDTLMVPLRSPPVPQVSMTRSAIPGGHRDPLRGGQHGTDQARHLLDRLALAAQPEHERGDLRRGGVPLEHVGQGGRRLDRGQVVAAGKAAKHPGPATDLLERRLAFRRHGGAAALELKQTAGGDG